MNLRTLGGPLLAFASAAAMLGLIAGLAAFLISDGRSSGDNDLVSGEYGISGPVSIGPTRRLADSYPFTPYFRLPDGSEEVRVRTDGQRNDWFGEFVLPKAPTAALADLRLQAESNGLSTSPIRDSDGGSTSSFTFNGPQVGGMVLLFQFSRESHLLVINVGLYR